MNNLCDWLKNLLAWKKKFFCICIYKMNIFALLTAEAWKKSDVQFMEYGCEMWINQKHLQKKLDIANVADRTQYSISEFKKMRCKIQKCGEYQPCRH